MVVNVILEPIAVDCPWSTKDSFWQDHASHSEEDCGK